MPETSDARPADLDDRVRLDVPGSREVLDHFASIVATEVPPGVAAARALADAEVMWVPARPAIIDAGRSVILAGAADGPLLLARAFRAGEPTTVHDHGVAGAVLVVEGLERYERYERTSGGTARLESVHHLAAGDAMWWNESPDDVHRQEAITDIALELILVAAPPLDPTVFDVVQDRSDAATAGGQLRTAPVERA